MFNFSFLHSLDEMKQWTGNDVVLFGNIPPRDVLALGTPEQVADSVSDSLITIKDTRRIILSCGGGMPQDVSSENIKAFIDAAGKTGKI